MTITDAQLTLLGQKRKLTPPSFYNSATDSQQSIRGETEDALILIGGDVKQKAAQYLDLLLDANPSQGDYDAITARAAAKRLANATAALAELTPVVSDFSTFKDKLLGDASTSNVFYVGMLPLMTSLMHGIRRLRNQIDSLKFAKKINSVSAAKHASGLTDAQRKEWRSWKRVLLAYP